MNTYYPNQPSLQPDAGLARDVAHAINGEYSAIACYGQLMEMAANQKEKERIAEIRNDEIRHYHTFSSIYFALTNQHHSPSITEACPNTYRKGLAAAIEDEQKTVDFYNELADKAVTPYVKEQFRRAAADEQNHAVWFLYFYVMEKAKKG